ncbi:MAG: thioredoxin domain-containing protein [Actinomyces sp.]|nr:MAG: thioredoxin domain-containing protein [Actinomyces sp.]
MNRLADETSPYLRQHRDNPVDWWPWGPDALAEAARTDRPLLISIGYAACHWCHVMAHESFEDPDTAELMNAHYVCVKVDREERPDVDAVYMEAVQALTGQGGWPLTVFATPDGRPFFGGTYYPRHPRPGLPSFRQILVAVHEAWTERRDEVLAQADRLTSAIDRTNTLVAVEEVPDDPVLDDAVAALVAAADRDFGGFGGAPKFPQPLALDALLTVASRTGDPDAVAVVAHTIEAMAAGGIHDHLGGGFHRYAVDQRWQVPHFEKMLYDQALVGRVLVHLHRLTGDPTHRWLLDRTLDAVESDLGLPVGAFASSLDADSEGVEGRYYVWTPDEIRRIAGDDAEAAIEWWGVTEAGNFEGATILHRPRGAPLIPPPEVERARRALLDARSRRVPPGLDDKVLTEWNAHLVTTLTEAAVATGRDDRLDRAVTTAEFLCTHLRDEEGRWYRSWQGTDAAHGRARHRAYAHDLAALVDAFTRLGEATGRARWIHEARSVADRLLDDHLDTERGGFFTTAHDAERLVTRPKDLTDGATPSPQSTAAVALLRLEALTGESRYGDAARGVLRLLGDTPRRAPLAFGHLLVALELHHHGIDEVALVGDVPDLLAAYHARWRPRSVLAWGEPYPSPLWDQRRPGFAYVCRRFVCRAPTDDPDELARQLAP